MAEMYGWGEGKRLRNPFLGAQEQVKETKILLRM